VILMMIDQEWRDHLAAMDDLRESVWTASYEQKEPLVVYQRMASQGFQELMDNIHRLVFQHYFLTEVVVAPQLQAGPRVFFQKQSPEEYQEAERQRMEAQANAGQPTGEGGGAAGAGGAPPRVPRPVTVKREAPKVGRNDPCPCGSGKKYKNCHGAPNRLAGTMPFGDKS
jgi:preprotein translocase subunit SecA